MARRKIEAVKEYKTKSGVTYYRFRIYVGVNPYTKQQATIMRSKFPTRQAAEFEYRHIENLVATNQWHFDNPDGDKDKLTYRDVYKEWVEAVYRPTVKSSTLGKTKQIFDVQILPRFGNKLITEITAKDAQEAITDWNKKYVKYETTVSYARKVFKYAVIKKIDVTDPFNEVIQPARKKQSEPKTDNFFETNELIKFLEFLKINTSRESNGDVEFFKAVFFRILALTGMRKGELLALTVGDVDFDENKININKTVVYDENKHLDIQPPKWDSYRVIDIDSKTMELLKEWLNQLQIVYELNDDQLIFPSKNNTWFNLGKPNNWLDALISLGKEQYSVLYQTTKDEKYKKFVHRITPHGFRHTHATWLFENNPNMPFKAVQYRLGHRTLKETMEIYSHVTDKMKGDLKGALDDIDF